MPAAEERGLLDLGMSGGAAAYNGHGRVVVTTRRQIAAKLAAPIGWEQIVSDIWWAAGLKGYGRSAQRNSAS
jgi:hypothetical protein